MSIVPFGTHDGKEVLGIGHRAIDERRADEHRSDRQRHEQRRGEQHPAGSPTSGTNRVAPLASRLSLVAKLDRKLPVEAVDERAVRLLGQDVRRAHALPEQVVVHRSLSP